MADDEEADPELIALLRQSLGLGTSSQPRPADTGVLDSASYIYNNSIDVAVDMFGTKRAAAHIWQNMQRREYSTQNWSEHELHPKTKDEAALDFIFTMDLLNFCFWSDDLNSKFTVEYHDKQWTGYWGLVAALHRALDEGIPITSPFCWYMTKRSLITKAPATGERDEVDDEAADETPETQKVEASEESGGREDQDPMADSDSELVQKLTKQDGLMAASDDGKETRQDTDKSEPVPDTVPPSQSVEASKSPQTETEEVEEEVLISKELLAHVFRSQTTELLPLLDERLECLHEAGKVLHKHFGGSIAELVRRANESTATLVNLLVQYFPCFRDESRFERRQVKFYKRAQILVADLWAAFNGEQFGKFSDVDKLTMFAVGKSNFAAAASGVLSKFGVKYSGKTRRQK
ncbi:MAG: hypothetical protein Q9157_004455 [Trypethelium eluteriae]